MPHNHKKQPSKSWDLAGYNLPDLVVLGGLRPLTPQNPGGYHGNSQRADDLLMTLISCIIIFSNKVLHPTHSFCPDLIYRLS